MIGCRKHFVNEMASNPNLDAMSLAEIKGLCKTRGVKYSGKGKAELIELLAEAGAYLKPPLKWVGGKTQHLNDLLPRFPRTIRNYHEPFLGGGSVLLAVLSARQAGAITITGGIYASDINPHLITLYQTIQRDVSGLLNILKPLCEGYATTTQPEAYYYAVREQFNSQIAPIEKAARLIFLNKTGFRGLYREGPNGLNVPFGNYKNPQIYDPTHLMQIAELIQPVLFTTQSFVEALTGFAAPGGEDFVYMDPPYAPETNTSFVGYVADGFCDHKTLFDMCSQIPRFIMSNANVPLVREGFARIGVTIDTIQSRRAINSKRPDAQTTEVIIQRG